MWDEAWSYDLICRDEDSILGKLDWEDFLRMKEAQPLSAMKIYSRIMKHLQYQLIYNLKNNDDYYQQYMKKNFDVL